MSWLTRVGHDPSTTVKVDHHCPLTFFVIGQPVSVDVTVDSNSNAVKQSLTYLKIEIQMRKFARINVPLYSKLRWILQYLTLTPRWISTLSRFVCLGAGITARSIFSSTSRTPNNDMGFIWIMLATWINESQEKHVHTDHYSRPVKKSHHNHGAPPSLRIARNSLKTNQWKCAGYQRHFRN